jgi:hypothetical protein
MSRPALWRPPQAVKGRPGVGLVGVCVHKSWRNGGNALLHCLISQEQLFWEVGGGGCL